MSTVRGSHRWGRFWRLITMVLGVAVLVPLVPAPSLANGVPIIPTGDDADEIFFYRDDGLFRYYDIAANGAIGSPILQGSGYTAGWSSITAVDLDGDRLDEMFFYRDDGLFRFYNVDQFGNLGSPILQGSGYTAGWSSITAVDLDGDGQDEMFFYRDDGLFRYYDVSPSGQLGSPILQGSGYTAGWSSITAVDLDGDGQDEMFFYRDDGLFRYYDIRPDGTIGKPILAGTGYTTGWSSITAIDLDGDGQDEMFFYRDDGLFRYYNISPNGQLGSPLLAGDGYTAGWSAITAVNLDLQPTSTSFGSGIWRVGTDIPPGTYRMNSTQPSCYWARLSGFSGTLDDIITNNFTSAQQLVTIEPSDAGFESAGCGTWMTLLKPASRKTTNPFGDGMWLVAQEVAAGTWQNSDSSQGCYWERLEGFSGELFDIIANQFTFDPTIVTISSGDTGFHSVGCGVWTYSGP